MCPIEKVSDVRRMPRLGKIRLGLKVEPEGKNPYPRATDYFVVPDEIKDYVGDMPKKLNIMFPTEGVVEFAPQWLRCYSFTQGLVCKGDGVKATRKIDVETGDIARHTTQEWVFKDWGCDPDNCEQYLEKQCRRVMNLLFLIPDVPGLGVWQLDTTSFYSIVNVNSCVDLIKRLCGRISFIPLTLSLEPQIVEPPGIKKKTVHILQIRSDVKLADLQKLGLMLPERVLLPALEEEEAPGDLFPAEAKPEAGKERPAEPREEKTPDDIAEDDVPDMDAVVRFCFHFWQMKPVEVCGEFGYKTMRELNDSRTSPWEAWLTIKQLKQPEKPGEEPGPEPAEEQAEEPAEQQIEPLWPEDLPGAEPAPEPEPEPTGAKGFIDMDWLEKSLKSLQAKKLKAWSESNLLSYIKTTYRVEGKTVLEAVAKMDKGAAAHFRKRVEETLQMI
ncbi:hypothetical protein ES703_73234 [subsurface metagenome]